MAEKPDLDLLRLLTGELDAEEAARLRDRLAGEPELEEEYLRLESVWAELELPETATASREFSRRVASAAASAGGGRIRWSMAPRWAHAAAAFALAGGIVLGLGLGGGVAGGETLEIEAEDTLADSYWLLLEGTGDAADPDEEVGP